MDCCGPIWVGKGQSREIFQHIPAIKWCALSPTCHMFIHFPTPALLEEKSKNLKQIQQYLKVGPKHSKVINERHRHQWSKLCWRNNDIEGPGTGESPESSGKISGQFPEKVPESFRNILPPTIIGPHSFYMHLPETFILTPGLSKCKEVFCSSFPRSPKNVVMGGVRSPVL